jgi:hypothetical protein
MLRSVRRARFRELFTTVADACGDHLTGLLWAVDMLHAWPTTRNKYGREYSAVSSPFCHNSVTNASNTRSGARRRAAV